MSPSGGSARERLFQRPSRRQRTWLREQLRDETTGGLVLLVAAAIALIWANSPWGASYLAFTEFTIGPRSLHLDLSVAQWTADGLLAVFFFVVGLELKFEFVYGSLARLSRAAVPIAAAIGGMVLPAAIYAVVNLRATDGAPQGWGVPMATDIAFALAALAVIGRGLPVALRAFLLTLAVVDDLGAITVIAVFYSSEVSLGWLAASAACIVVYAIGQRLRWTTPLFYLPVALLAWGFLHASGVHATIAGVALGLLTRVRPDDGEHEAPAVRLQHRVHPLSAGVCVPLFALTASGVVLGEIGLGPALTSPVALGIIIGLVVGKPLGIIGTSWLVARFTRASLARSITWADVTAVGMLAGIGFTVALLISELAFVDARTLAEAKIGIITASLLAAAMSALLLLTRRRAARPARVSGRGPADAGPGR